MAKRLTTEQFVAIARGIHDDRYDYSLVVYQGRHIHVTIICPEHGSFDQKPVYHTLRKAGCPECAKWICPRDTFEDFVNKATATHGTKYIYREENYTSSTIKMSIECPMHGIFTQLPFAHVFGQGCVKCGIASNTDKRRKPVELYIKQAQAIHGAVYNYDKLIEYEGSQSKIEVLCHLHGSFFPRAGDHLRGSKCPKCSTNKLYSYAAIEWLTHLSNVGCVQIQHAENVAEYNIPGTRFKVDGFCPETNTVYEFYGDFWHGHPTRYDPLTMNKITNKTMGELYERTLQREEIIRSLGYNLVTIWESEWNELKNKTC